MANLAYWKERTKIDYFTHFIQTYILFNAWYRGTYTSLKQEREILDEIKFKPNLIRNRMVPMLEDLGDAEAHQLRSQVALLHQRLETMHLHDKDGQRITCKRVGLGMNPQLRQTGSYSGISYEVNCSNRKAIRSVVTKANGYVAFDCTQTDGYNWQTVEAHSDFTHLSGTQASQLQNHYRRANPRLTTDLLDLNGGTHIPFGTYQFCANTEHIFAGLIGIIYDLRNLLFHGELVPADNYNETYGAAYHVLQQFVKNIPDTV